jgi:hypothetical protein
MIFLRFRACWIASPVPTYDSHPFFFGPFHAAVGGSDYAMQNGRMIYEYQKEYERRWSECNIAHVKYWEFILGACSHLKYTSIVGCTPPALLGLFESLGLS